MLKDEKGLLGNIIKVLSANIWVSFIGLVSSFIFPKILSLDDYSIYQTYILYLSYISVLHLGFPSGMVLKYAGKDYEKIDNEKYKSEIIIIVSLLSFFTIVFLIIAILSNNQMLLFIAISIIPYDFIGIYKALLQAWGEFKKYGIISTVVTTCIPTVAICYYLVKHSLPGTSYILINIIINWMVGLFLFSEIAKKINGTCTAPIFTKENWEIEKNGVSILIGNYINSLFTSVDKQFVKSCFDSASFAYYSFGMSMQALMIVFITSISQPLLPTMAKKEISDKEYDYIKVLLIIFGSLSGCAYFVASIFVKMYIPKYINSLEVIGIYFVVFPVVAVINCLYINLYKVKNMMATYVKTIAGILLLSIILNICAVTMLGNYLGITVATSVTYYCWFAIGIKQFDCLKISVNDVLYLSLYTIGFFVITRLFQGFAGMLLYSIFILALIIILYRKYAKKLIIQVRSSFNER